MTILIPILSLLQVIACPSYKCSSSISAYPSQSVCLVPDAEKNTNYVNACKSGYLCSLNNQYKNECYPTSQHNTGTQVAGAFCNYDEDCVQNNYCLNNKCKGLSLNSRCQVHLDCDVGLFCNYTNLLCTPQIKVGGTGCFLDAHCVNNAGCQTYSPTNPRLNRCAKYFSLNDYTAILNCSSAGDINYLCKSGFCVNIGTSICYPAPTLTKSSPVECSVNSDCNSKLTGDLELVFSSSCQCGLNPNGKQYCSVLPGDSVYNEYDEMVRDWVESDDITKCNTYGRFGNGCIETHWSGKKYREFNRKMIRAMSYPQVVDSDKCVLKWGMPQYYELLEESFTLFAGVYLIGLVIS